MRGFIEITLFVGVFTLLLGVALNFVFKGSSVNIISGEARAIATVKEATNSDGEITTALEVKALSTTTLEKISADAVLVIYKSSNIDSVLLEKNINKEYYLASLSKIMTAILSDELLPKTATTTITNRIMAIKGSAKKFPIRSAIDAENLIKALLVESNNDAAWMLADKTGSTTQFIKNMNEKSKQYGLSNTSFGNPAGLDPSSGIGANMGTASDMAKLIWQMYKEKPSLAAISVLPKTDIRSANGNILYNASTTNELLTDNSLDFRIEAQKTGETKEAEKNLALVLHSDKIDGYFITIFLKSKNHFEDANIVMDAISSNLE